MSDAPLPSLAAAMAAARPSKTAPARLPRGAGLLAAAALSLAMWAGLIRLALLLVA